MDEEKSDLERILELAISAIEEHQSGEGSMMAAKALVNKYLATLGKPPQYSLKGKYLRHDGYDEDDD